MTGSEPEELKRLRDLGICPNCGKRIPEGTTVNRGVGAFCSLDCVASYYQAEFAERSRRLAAAARN